jgi:hypothetical protein
MWNRMQPIEQEESSDVCMQITGFDTSADKGMTVCTVCRSAYPSEKVILVIHGYHQPKTTSNMYSTTICKYASICFVAKHKAARVCSYFLPYLCNAGNVIKAWYIFRREFRTEPSNRKDRLQIVLQYNRMVVFRYFSESNLNLAAFQNGFPVPFFQFIPQNKKDPSSQRSHLPKIIRCNRIAVSVVAIPITIPTPATAPSS